MSEMSEQPLFNPQLVHEIGSQVGSQLLDAEKFADLGVDDLVRFGVIGSQESFPDAVGRRLGLGKRITDLS